MSSLATDVGLCGIFFIFFELQLFLFVLQQLRSAEMLEMHQRTREAVDSIVQHYQVIALVSLIYSRDVKRLSN